MAVVMKGACADVGRSSCEDPQFPSWQWRFARNQHMTHYYPWQIRDEQWPPNYRNMGMHRNFRFHPMETTLGSRPLTQLGVNFCHDLRGNRRAGFGNGALGKSPGPAPPRLFAYAGANVDDMYRVNEIHQISNGLSLLGYQPLPTSVEPDDQIVPLNPSHYMDQTLGQVVEIPGTFPQFNKALPVPAGRPGRQCPPQGKCCLGNRDPMTVWQERFARHQAAHALEQSCGYSEPRSSSQLNSSSTKTHQPQKCLTMGGKKYYAYQKSHCIY